MNCRVVLWHLGSLFVWYRFLMKDTQAQKGPFSLCPFSFTGPEMLQFSLALFLAHGHRDTSRGSRDPMNGLCRSPGCMTPSDGFWPRRRFAAPGEMIADRRMVRATANHCNALRNAVERSGRSSGRITQSPERRSLPQVKWSDSQPAQAIGSEAQSSGSA